MSETKTESMDPAVIDEIGTKKYKRIFFNF